MKRNLVRVIVPLTGAGKAEHGQIVRCRCYFAFPASIADQCWWKMMF